MGIEISRFLCIVMFNKVQSIDGEAGRAVASQGESGEAVHHEIRGCASEMNPLPGGSSVRYQTHDLSLHKIPYIPSLECTKELVD